MKHLLCVFSVRVETDEYAANTDSNYCLCEQLPPATTLLKSHSVSNHVTDKKCSNRSEYNLRVF